MSIISYARLSNVSNKRITRIKSDKEVDKSELKSEGNEALLNTTLINRNPRNLEQLLLESKTLGFELDLPQRHFWNKVVFEKKSKYLTAKIVHHSGRVLVTASTKELAISEQLKSTGSISASIIIGQILAVRALESGFSQVFVDHESKTDNSQKMKEFLKSFESNGITLKEQPFIFSRKRRDY